MQSAPINMLVLVVGLIGGSIHVLPPPHISLPLCLITLHYLPILPLKRTNCMLLQHTPWQHIYDELRETNFWGADYSCLARVHIREVTYAFPYTHTCFRSVIDFRTQFPSTECSIQFIHILWAYIVRHPDLPHLTEKYPTGTLLVL
jgi:hypothetical protein